MTLEQQMEAIRNGRMVQFAPLIQVPIAQLALGQELEIRLPGLCSTFWLPPTVVMPDYSVWTNPLSAQLGIRMNLRSAPMLHWGLKGNLVANFTGPLERIFVTPIIGPYPNDFVFLAARGIGINYSGGLTAAGTASGAPGFGLPPSAQT